MSNDVLFQPITLGEIELPNRIVMASMSRARTENPSLVPTPLQAEYYRQRASAGLILTEGVWPSREAIGAINVPGLFTDEQAEGWKRVTDAVHEAGGRIVVQLGHCGAVSHPDLLGGAQPVGPSAVSVNQQVFTPDGFRNSPVPRAMTLDDISRTVADYAHATRRARAAGFDGVELHGTVGYLIPQFLNDTLNRRDDAYGGGVENRTRFPLEVLEAMASEWRPGRVGLKLSPAVSMGDLHPTAQTLPTYEHLVAQASQLKLAYVQFQDSEADLVGTPVEALKDGAAGHFRKFFDGAVIANGGLTQETAAALIRSGAADAASFGTPYLSNPDLVERFMDQVALAPTPPRDTWYAGGAAGYADYPRATVRVGTMTDGTAGLVPQSDAGGPAGKGEMTTPVPGPSLNQPHEDRTILVFGATGQQGGVVARALRSRGWKVRAFVRDITGARAEALIRLGVELSPGDLSDTASIRKAITGAYGVFSVQPNSGQGPQAGLSDADEVRYANTIADLAVEQGVKHLVYASTILLSKGPTGVANLDCKLEIEAHLRSLALGSTVVRPGTFMELLLQPGVAPDEGIFTFLVGPDQPAQLIAVDDIGRIVAGVFDDPERYAGQALNIAGDAPTGREMAEQLGAASGRPVQYRRYSDAVLAENPVLARTVRAFEPGRSEEADIEALNRAFGKLFTFQAWLAGPGGRLLRATRHAAD